MTVVLDASAVLVLLLDEPGAKAVADAVPDAALSAASLAEVLSTLGDRGVDTSGLVDHLAAAGVQVEPVTERDAVEVTRLRLLDTGKVLNLGDRCCLALARRLTSAVLTADGAWSGIESGVEVRQVR